MQYNIQILRAIAAYLVVFYHLDRLLGLIGVRQETLLPATAGVDLFFVISGFVMVHTSIRKPTTPGSFIVNRIVRIVPLYWLLTFATCAVALSVPALLGSTQVTLPALVKSLFFIPYMRTSGLIQPILFLGWTLNYEMFFYLIFAASLLIGNFRLRLTCSSAIIVLLVVLGQLTHPKGIFARFYTAPIMLEFAIGMWVAAIHAQGRFMQRPVAWTVLILGAIALISWQIVYPDGQRGWWSGIPSGIVVMASLSLEARGTVWRSPFFQLLGAGSYALYLLHPFLVQVVAKIAASTVGGSALWVMIWCAIALLLAGFSAIALHLLIERPFTNFLRRLVHHPSPIVERDEKATLAALPGGTRN